MISHNYQKVLEEIANTAKTVGRSRSDIRLVVVTKGHSLEVVQMVVEAGARYLGENYLEEAIPKIESLPRSYKIEWHMVGHVQSRKAKSVCEQFHRVDSVDRVKLATRLDRFATELNRSIPVLLECNVSGESSKYGFPAWDEKRWPMLLPDVERIVGLNAIKVCGLMTMPPYFSNVEEVRPYFRRLFQLREFLAEHVAQVNWTELSMGMSNDYKIAIEEGATMVRIGTAILGERKSK